MTKNGLRESILHLHGQIFDTEGYSSRYIPSVPKALSGVRLTESQFSDNQKHVRPYRAHYEAPATVLTTGGIQTGPVIFNASRRIQASEGRWNQQSQARNATQIKLQQHEHAIHVCAVQRTLTSPVCSECRTSPLRQQFHPGDRMPQGPAPE